MTGKTRVFIDFPFCRSWINSWLFGCFFLFCPRSHRSDTSEMFTFRQKTKKKSAQTAGAFERRWLLNSGNWSRQLETIKTSFGKIILPWLLEMLMKENFSGAWRWWIIHKSVSAFSVVVLNVDSLTRLRWNTMRRRTMGWRVKAKRKPLQQYALLYFFHFCGPSLTLNSSNELSLLRLTHCTAVFLL